MRHLKVNLKQTKYNGGVKRFLSASFALGLSGILAVWFNYQWPQIAPSVVKAKNAMAAALPKQPAQNTTQKESNKIQDLLNKFAINYPGQVSVVAIDLSNNAQGAVAAKDQLVSASLYKMYVAWGVYQKIDANMISASDMVGNLGEDVATCLQAMIEVSDNDCGASLGFMIGWQNLDQNLKGIGLTGTQTNNYDPYGNLTGDKITTANDVAMFLKQLYTGELLSPTSTGNFIELLKNDQINNWLPSGLPAGTTIAHKTGDLYDAIYDAGIIYSPKGNYLEVLMTHGWNDPFNQAPPVFANLSGQLWNFFSS